MHVACLRHMHSRPALMLFLRWASAVTAAVLQDVIAEWLIVLLHNRVQRESTSALQGGVVAALPFVSALHEFSQASLQRLDIVYQVLLQGDGIFEPRKPTIFFA